MAKTPSLDELLDGVTVTHTDMLDEEHQKLHPENMFMVEDGARTIAYCHDEQIAFFIRLALINATLNPVKAEGI